MVQDLSNKKMPKLLVTVPFDKGFHFKVESGAYTGLTATSLFEFAEKVKVVDVNSILFHYPRGDFQNWVENTVGDKELANRFCFVRTGLSGESLRNQLLKITQKRIRELKK
jgi:alpha-amylase